MEKQEISPIKWIGGFLIILVIAFSFVAFIVWVGTGNIWIILGGMLIAISLIALLNIYLRKLKVNQLVNFGLFILLILGVLMFVLNWGDRSDYVVDFKLKKIDNMFVGGLNVPKDIASEGGTYFFDFSVYGYNVSQVKEDWNVVIKHPDGVYQGTFSTKSVMDSDEPLPYSEYELLGFEGEFKDGNYEFFITFPDSFKEISDYDGKASAKIIIYKYKYK